MSREVFFVGSVTDSGNDVRPADAVFDAFVRGGVAPQMRYVPDGEQIGWLRPLLTRLSGLPVFEPGRRTYMTRRPTTFFGTMDWTMLKLKDGASVSDIHLSLDLADSAIASYEAFKARKEKGDFPPDARFVATLPGPGSVFFQIELPASEVFPIAIKAYQEEIARIVAAIPHDQLAIQLDLAAEVEIEEFHRRPDDWDIGVYETVNWTIDEQASMLAEICDSIPEDAHLGFHLCALYHIDQSQGQDMNVHVDFANALCEKTKRTVNYIHIPTVPSHDEDGLKPLSRLHLNPGTKLELGVIHIENGVDGAKRLVNAAAASYPDFGISTFCGLKQPSRTEYESPHPLNEIIALHRQVADL